VSRRKPVELRAIEGNLSHRPLPNTPKAGPLLADPPPTLGPRGREMWQRVRNAFPEAPVVQESDYSALLALCQSWEIAQAAYDDLTSRGVIVKSSRADRELVRNPCMMVWGSAMEKVTKLLGQFGLTPLDRSRFDVSKPKPLEDDPTARAIAVARRWRWERGSRRL
jgi:P27 family predicted phage terminase small subunit